MTDLRSVSFVTVRHVTIRHITVLLLTILGLCAPAFGQEPRPEPVPTYSPEPSPAAELAFGEPRYSVEPQGPWWRDGRLASELDLSDDVVERLEELYLDYRLRLTDLRADLDRARVELDHARRGGDEGLISAADDQRMDAELEVRAARTEMLVALRAELSAEQWRSLGQLYRSLMPTAPRAPSPPTPPSPASPPSPPSPSSSLYGQPPSPASPPTPPSPASPPAPPSSPPGLYAPSAPAPAASPSPTPAPRPSLAPAPAPAPSPAPAPRPALAPTAPVAPLAPSPPLLTWWSDADVLAALELDAEQLAQLEDRITEWNDPLRDASREVRAEEEKLDALVARSDLRTDEARAQVGRVNEARRRLAHVGRDLEKALLDVLRPAQRSRLSNLHVERF